MYKPNKNFNTAIQILTPTTTLINGIEQKTYTDGPIFYGLVKTYGGSDSVKNGILVNDNTCVIDTFFNPEITKNIKIKMLDDNTIWEVIGIPENIERKNLFMQLKARQIIGGV